MRNRDGKRRGKWGCPHHNLPQSTRMAIEA
ncbi:unnamed protein product, partial [Vitis vinifera]|uniref:Uncharacterized protein n=1 Tax=Vitis vinifera TaxID=29760 RepID=D7T4Y2_VITVI